MKATHLKTGELGEAIAVQYLLKRGFTVIERNYRRKWGEIDVICETRYGVIHFVEVKATKISVSSDYSPIEHIHSKKKGRLRRAVQTYINENDLHDSDTQIDAIAVYIDTKTKRATVEYFDNVVL